MESHPKPPVTEPFTKLSQWAGHSAQTVVSRATDEMTCKQFCAQQSGCVGFTHHATTDSCALHDRGVLTTKPGFVQGSFDPDANMYVKKSEVPFNKERCAWSYYIGGWPIRECFDRPTLPESHLPLVEFITPRITTWQRPKY